MALELITTLAGELSNSYCDVAFADDYWTNHFSATKAAQWAALSATQKVRLLIQACKIIEGVRFTVPITLPDYALHYDRRTGKVLDINLTRNPVKYFYYQKLQFPRNLDVYYETVPTDSQENALAHLGDIYMREEPQIAQCEQAIYTLNFDETSYSNRLQGITLDTLGLGRQQLAQTQEYGTTGSMLAPMAAEILRPLMVKGGRLQRG